ncbi:MAG: endonuclease/exonuclease/phosphatase family protein [Verrucomicrobia bacterium]|nr:endonuclease/exonuclease/phosphatase family protein [Verrucomicrobiota bacterium]
MTFFFRIALFVFAFCLLVERLPGQTVTGVSNGTRNFRVMTFNIHHGVGVDGVLDTERIASVIALENADLVGLQEVDRWTTRVNGRDLVQELSDLTGLDFVFYGRPYQGGQFGNAILSRFPIKSSEERLLPRTTGTELRRAVRAVVVIDGRDFSFWNTHLAASAEDEAERLACVTLFNEWLQQEKAPAVFCGDFNDFPDRNVHLLMKQSWNDVWEQVGLGDGFTFPARGPNRRIDYIFTAKENPIEVFQAAVPYTTASDHLPLIATMRLLPVPEEGFRFLFDEGEGSTINDSIHGLAGSILGSLAWSVDSPSGHDGDCSFTFSGVNRIQVDDPERLIRLSTNHGDYTLQAWVKLPIGHVSINRMILFQYEGDPGFSLSITTNRFLHTTTFRKKDMTSAAQIPDDGAWHHVAAVHHDKSQFEFYIDGVLQSIVPYADGPGTRDNPVITIGSAAGQGSSFSGSIDRAMFTPQALSSIQFDFPEWPRGLLPKLKAHKQGEEIIFYWPSASRFSLEARGLLSDSPWVAVPHITSGKERQSTVAIEGDQRYFRLKRSSFLPY